MSNGRQNYDTMYNLLYIVLASSQDPFGYIRKGLARFLMVLLGIFAVVSLVVVVVQLINGDRDGAKKFVKWFVALLFGFIFFGIISNL